MLELPYEVQHRMDEKALVLGSWEKLAMHAIAGSEVCALFVGLMGSPQVPLSSIARNSSPTLLLLRLSPALPCTLTCDWRIISTKCQPSTRNFLRALTHPLTLLPP